MFRQDPFVIAIAMVKSGTVVTEEKPMATSPSREFPMCATRLACTAWPWWSTSKPRGGRSQRVRLRGIAHPFGSVPRTCQDRHEHDGQGDTDPTCRLRWPGRTGRSRTL